VLLLLATYRLLAPGSEWHLHYQWFEGSAMADLLGEDAGLAEIHKLYRCHDRLLEHKQALFDHLVGRWRDLFNINFDVLLYDLTSTYFEADPPFPEGDKRRHGYSRDHRSDCVQVIIALVVTPEGLPLAYEVLPGNTADNTTLKGFLARIEAHIFIAFLAYCLHVTLGRRLHALAPGLTPRSVIEKFTAVQMIDLHVPTTDGRELLLTRYTEPEPELALLLDKLKFVLPAQPQPKSAPLRSYRHPRRSEDLRGFDRRISATYLARRPVWRLQWRAHHKKPDPPATKLPCPGPWPEWPDKQQDDDR
jgi:hypothetical protein